MTNEKPENAIVALARTLGEGWTAVPFSGHGDGQLTGPGGEKVWIKLYLGEASLVVDLLGGEPVPSYCQRTTTGEAFGNMVKAITDLYPTWQQAHQADLQRQADLPAAQEAFACEVAAHLGEGWAGGVEGGWASLKVFVANDSLRIQWEPVEYAPRGAHKMADRLTLRAVGSRERITVSATRTAKDVAREITRRLLPDYLATLQEEAEKKARHLQAVADVQKIVALVEKHGAGLDPTVPAYISDSAENIEVRLHAFDVGSGTLYGTADCRPDGVYLKIEVGKLDPKAAKIMLGAIAKAAAKLQAQAGNDD